MTYPVVVDGVLRYVEGANEDTEVLGEVIGKLLAYVLQLESEHVSEWQTTTQTEAECTTQVREKYGSIDLMQEVIDAHPH